MSTHYANALTGTRILIAVLTLLIATPWAFSQEATQTIAAQPATHTVYFKFVSSRTGAAVTPAKLSVEPPTAEKIPLESGLVPMQLPEGRHSIAVEAEGFHPMTAEVVVTPGDNPVMTFELDPSGAEETQALPDNAAVVEGYVTDADSGQLLEKVTLSLPGSDMTTSTDSSGHYEFQVQVPPSSESVHPAVTLEAQAEGYIPLRIRNLSLAAGQRRHMPLSLEKETSDTLAGDIRESDESQNAGNHRSFDWVFDATIR